MIVRRKQDVLRIGIEQLQHTITEQMVVCMLAGTGLDE